MRNTWLALFTIILSIADVNAGFAQVRKFLTDTDFHRAAGYSLPWKPINDSDVYMRSDNMYQAIEVYDLNNTVLRYDLDAPEQNVFGNVLLAGIVAGIYKAYSDKDTLFTSPLTTDQLDTIIACNIFDLSYTSCCYLNYVANHAGDSILFHTYSEYAPHSGKTDMRGYDMRRYDSGYVGTCVYPQQVAYYGIRENHIMYRRKRPEQRIVAIAPMIFADGWYKPLFWVKYADAREYVAKYSVYKGKKKLDINWDEYFDARLFTSAIYKIRGKDKRHDGGVTTRSVKAN